MSIKLQDSRLQALVEQMTANAGSLSSDQVGELVDAAYADDGRLSSSERSSLKELLQAHADLFESPAARDKLGTFQRMSSARLRDAAHRFAADGHISRGEAQELKDIALQNGRLSRNEKVTLKALMGFYSPEMEPGAQDLVNELLEQPNNQHSVDPTAAAVQVELVADGKIETSELQATEDKLAQTYGRDKAKEILLTALGVDPTKISFEAIDYLQGNVGKMDGHIERYQQVLQEHLAGAKLLDANFDGKLDKNDLIFRKGADGEVNVEKIGKALSDRVRIGAAMVDAAYAMAEAKHEFGDLRANEFVWEIDEDDPNVMYLNPENNIPPSVALMDIFNNPDLYQFECATAMVILRYRAMLDLIGEKDFNRICKDIRIGVWEQEDHAAKIWKVSGRALQGDEVEMTPETRANLMPGDYTYFKNWDVSEAAFRGGWQGENVIYLGNGKYYGHPFRVIDGKDIVKYLNQNRKYGSTRSAGLLDLHAVVSSDVLKYDKDPTD